jgi:SET domain-containing protein
VNPAVPATNLDLSIEVRPQGQGNGVFATAPIRQWDVLVALIGPRCSEPSRHTIQVDAETHLDEEGFVQGYLNHSCEPNAFVDFSNPDEVTITSLRAIEPGEEVRINYCATEEDMAEPFSCDCRSPKCYGTVSGFVNLDVEQQEDLAGLLSPHIRDKHGPPPQVSPPNV